MLQKEIQLAVDKGEMLPLMEEFYTIQGEGFYTGTAAYFIRVGRCGWFDAVAMKRAIQVNSISGFCLTKLDVLDGLDEVKICIGYKGADGTVRDVPPMAADDYELVTPVYETMPGWTENTFGAKSIAELPQAAINYIKRIEAITGTPVDIISTGPDRDETMILRHPFAD
jgi:adenylosuccinate synthase